MTRSLRAPATGTVEALGRLGSTSINFAAVLIGLILVAWRLDGPAEVATLNLWSAWGIFLALFGQIGLVAGVLDGKSGLSTKVLTLSLIHI